MKKLRRHFDYYCRHQDFFEIKNFLVFFQKVLIKFKKERTEDLCFGAYVLPYNNEQERFSCYY